MRPTMTTLLELTGQLLINQSITSPTLCANLYRVKLPDGTESDLLNETRAKDLLSTLKERRDAIVRR